ncbi:MAG: topoisomerase II, partial [Actinobacteria bacterium]|nr:topoisomerase II [Actinomycetota bacterium]
MQLSPIDRARCSRTLAVRQPVRLLVMAKVQNPKVASEDVPVVGMREPCPCGSGRRYKACHGRDQADRGSRLVLRPFEGLAGECDWVALRNFVPAATSALHLKSDTGIGDRKATLVTVLPLAWPAMVRDSGEILLALQTATGSGDPSRDAAEAILRALDTEPGAPVPPVGLPGPGPRLQDVLTETPIAVSVESNFDFWMADPDAERTPEVVASLERVSQSAIPTARLSSIDVGAGYWCAAGNKEHLRWVLPFDEETALT